MLMLCSTYAILPELSIELEQFGRYIEWAAAWMTENRNSMPSSSKGLFSLLQSFRPLIGLSQL